VYSIRWSTYFDVICIAPKQGIVLLICTASVDSVLVIHNTYTYITYIHTALSSLVSHIPCACALAAALVAALVAVLVAAHGHHARKACIVKHCACADDCGHHACFGAWQRRPGDCKLFVCLSVCLSICYGRLYVCIRLYIYIHMYYVCNCIYTHTSGMAAHIHTYI
jgi:hypothetical protein